MNKKITFFLTSLWCCSLFAQTHLPSPNCEKPEISSILSKFEEYTEQTRKDWQIVGMAVAIVKDGKVVYAKGFGQKSLDDTAPVNTETIFQVGSLTKAFTSCLTAIAVDKQKLKWDQSVSEIFPEFMLNDPWVTRAFQIQDLYAQRSGLPGYSGDMQAELGFSIQEMIANIRHFEPVSSFRSKFAYQNIFFSVGAEILSQVTGKNYASLLAEEIFKPLSMNNTTASLEEYKKSSNKAGWHIRKAAGNVVKLSMDIPNANSPYVYEASGGINSNVTDFANWLMLQAGSGKFGDVQIVSAENLKCTHRPYVFAGESNNADAFYCLGWLHKEYSPYPIIWHNGATAGVHTCAAIIPEEKLGIVVFCNTRDGVGTEAIVWQFFDLYYGKPDSGWNQKFLALVEAQDKETLEKIKPPANPASALPLDRYEGVYTNPIYGELLVSASERALMITVGPRKMRWRLQHFNRDTFMFLFEDVQTEGLQATFVIAPTGKADQINIDGFEGVFKRKESSKT